MVHYDVAVIGGGCVGVSVAKHLAERSEHFVCVVEKEFHLAQHQTGRNSGIIKPGFNYEPDSKKAELTIAGTRRMKEFHEEHDLPMLECGVMILATDEEEAERVHELKATANANDVETEVLETDEEIHEIEPNAEGTAALFCPEAASVDSQQFLYTLANEARKEGVEFYMGHGVTALSYVDGTYRIETDRGSLTADYVVNAAGVHADELAEMVGVGTEYQIVPFRGEYYELTPERSSDVNSMIYPTPDPELPFLGVHFTRRVDDKIIIGPNAVLAFGREAYRNTQFDVRDFVETLSYGGFWRLMGSKKMLGLAKDELVKSMNKSEFVADAQKLVPGLDQDDFSRSYSGIRSQLVSPEGKLVKNPRVLHGENSAHVMQTAWMTESLPFGESLAETVLQQYS